MKLDWDIDKIKKELNSDKINELKQYIYANMLYDIGEYNDGVPVRISRKSFFEALSKFDFNYIESSPIKLILYMSDNLPQYQINLIFNSNLNKSSSEIIKICQSFYKKNNKESLKHFKTIISYPNRIHFINDKQKSFYGRSYIFSSDLFYILINGNNFLQNSLSLIHEFKHVENKIKGYDDTIGLYKELPSILYEFYMIDYLKLYHNDVADVESIKINNIYKYVNMIHNLSKKIDLIKSLRDEVFYKNIYENYDLYYDSMGLGEIYLILKNGAVKEIGYILSFIVALDIYLKSKESNISNVLSCYIYGIYSMKPEVVNNVLNYINNSIDIENIDKNKINIKKGIDKV